MRHHSRCSSNSDSIAYRMRYGDECEGKMLDAKGDSGDKVMQLIKDANTLLEVTHKRKSINILIIFRV